MLRFLDRSISRTMGCFIGCFRLRSNSSRTNSVSAASKATAPAVSRNRLSSLFLDEEEKVDSQFVECGNTDLESPQLGRALKDEAKFLKACGTIPETPAEIRKASDKSLSSNAESESSKYHSWLPNTSIKELQSERPIGLPSSAIKLTEDWGTTDSQTPSSCISDAATSGRHTNTAIEGSEAMSSDVLSTKVHTIQNDNRALASNIHGKTKSVRFECDFDSSSSKGSSSESASRCYNKCVTPGDHGATKPLAYPTPLKLSDEMQTPGTVYPTNPDALAVGKTQIRSQYVYSVLSPVENAPKLNELKDEKMSSKEMFNDLRDSFEKLDSGIPDKEFRAKKEYSVKGKEFNVEGSLSSWLKPQPQSRSSSKARSFRVTDGDRPIIGMVAAHWNENEIPQISPKWWDGNGIPNSTTKYKEDQKVSWHATPFEERLEKALSEESLITQRKHTNQTPIGFDATDEVDTASSLLQHSAHSKAVISV